MAPRSLRFKWSEGRTGPSPGKLGCYAFSSDRNRGMIFGRCIFVTGGTGYIGSRLIRTLLPRGHTVRALVREGSRNKLPGGCEEIIGDALDRRSFANRQRRYLAVRAEGAHLSNRDTPGGPPGGVRSRKFEPNPSPHDLELLVRDRSLLRPLLRRRGLSAPRLLSGRGTLTTATLNGEVVPSHGVA